MRVLIVEDNPLSAFTIMQAIPEAEWVHVRTGLEGILALTTFPIVWDAMLLDMNLPGFIEHPWHEPLQWIPRFFKIEGDTVLKVAKATQFAPAIIIAISGIPKNNELLMTLGATHRVDGKVPETIRDILLNNGLLAKSATGMPSNVNPTVP